MLEILPANEIRWERKWIRGMQRRGRGRMVVGDERAHEQGWLVWWKRERSYEGKDDMLHSFCARKKPFEEHRSDDGLYLKWSIVLYFQWEYARMILFDVYNPLGSQHQTSPSDFSPLFQVVTGKTLEKSLFLKNTSDNAVAFKVKVKLYIRTVMNWSSLDHCAKTVLCTSKQQRHTRERIHGSENCYATFERPAK